MRQDGKRHILKSDGRTVEQLQMVRILHFHQGRDHLGVKLGVISTVDAVFQLFLSEICEELFHYRIGGLLVRHGFQLFHRHIQLRDIFRNEKAPVIGKSFQDRLGRCHFLLCVSCTVV